MTDIQIEQVRPLFTVKTLADYLGCSVRQVRVYIANGEIETFRLGQQIRIEPAEVDRFVREQKGSAA